MAEPPWPARFNRLRLLFWLFFLATIAYMMWVRNYLSPLGSDEIVQFEISKTVIKASSIIQGWKDTGKYALALKSVSFAYFFMILYTLAIMLGCRFLSACTRNEILIKGGRGFAWLILSATLCDIIENLSMSRTLHGHISPLNVLVTYNLARVKFSIVIVCILFMISCALYVLIAKFEMRKNNTL